MILSHSTNSIKIMLRELFTPNIQRIKSISAIGAMLQQVLLWFGIFLCGLVFAKAVSSTFPPCTLYGKNKIVIVLRMLAALDKVQTSLTLFSFAQHLAVEVRHQALLAWKNLGWWASTFHHVAWGCQDIHLAHSNHAVQTLHNYSVKVLIVHGIVRAKSGGIIVIDDTVVGMGRIVRAEVCNERRDFTFKFWISCRMQWTLSHNDEILHRNFLVCLMLSSH